MRHIKKTILRLFFVSELVVFGFVYLFGPYGMHTMQELKDEAIWWQEKQRIITAHIGSLNQEIDAWKSHDFYKEKEAREKLQMAHPDDIIYYVS